MTDKQEAFLEALFGEAEGSLTKAREIAGYSENTPITAILSSDTVSKEIEDRAKLFLNRTIPSALYTMLNAMTKDDMLGKREKMQAAKEFLDRAGITKTEKVEVETKTPLFILPSKDEN